MRQWLVICVILLISLIYTHPVYAVSKNKIDSMKQKAQHGDSDAKLWLCDYYYNYHHPQKAYYCFKQMTQQAKPYYQSRAYNTLGLMYRHGHEPVSKNYQKARQRFKKAIDLGYKAAYTNLAAIYQKGGYGISKDIKQAKHYYQLSAKAGYASASFGLGNLYANKKQYKKAFHWYHQSAKQYYLRGMYQTGAYYLLAKGVPEDKIKSCMWLKLALKVYPNYKLARGDLRSIESIMSYSQRHACRQQVKRYLKNHNVPRKSKFKARLELKS